MTTTGYATKAKAAGQLIQRLEQQLKVIKGQLESLNPTKVRKHQIQSQQFANGLNVIIARKPYPVISYNNETLELKYKSKTQEKIVQYSQVRYIMYKIGSKLINPNKQFFLTSTSSIKRLVTILNLCGLKPSITKFRHQTKMVFVKAKLDIKPIPIEIPKHLHAHNTSIMTPFTLNLTTDKMQLDKPHSFKRGNNRKYTLEINNSKNHKHCQHYIQTTKIDAEYVVQELINRDVRIRHEKYYKDHPPPIIKVDPLLEHTGEVLIISDASDTDLSLVGFIFTGRAETLYNISPNLTEAKIAEFIKPFKLDEQITATSIAIEFTNGINNLRDKLTSFFKSRSQHCIFKDYHCY